MGHDEQRTVMWQNHGTLHVSTIFTKVLQPRHVFYYIVFMRANKLTQKTFNFINIRKSLVQKLSNIGFKHAKPFLARSTSSRIEILTENDASN